MYRVINNGKVNKSYEKESDRNNVSCRVNALIHRKVVRRVTEKLNFVGIAASCDTSSDTVRAIFLTS